jgi:isoamylase
VDEGLVSAGFVSDVDAQGNRFNPNKLLFDPYARELSHDPNK